MLFRASCMDQEPHLQQLRAHLCADAGRSILVYRKAGECRSQVLVLICEMHPTRLTGEALRSTAHHQPHLHVTRDRQATLLHSGPCTQHHSAGMRVTGMASNYSQKLAVWGCSAMQSGCSDHSREISQNLCRNRIIHVMSGYQKSCIVQRTGTVLAKTQTKASCAKVR